MLSVATLRVAFFYWHAKCRHALLIMLRVIVPSVVDYLKVLHLGWLRLYSQTLDYAGRALITLFFIKLRP
jgi:hypothetical protein